MKLTGIIMAFCLSFLALLTPYTVLAVDTLDNACDEAGVTGSSFCNNVENEKSKGDRILGKDGIITNVTQVIVFGAGAISVIMVVLGGFKYVVSGGDSNATASAKNTILYALIGLVVALFSQIIVSFVLSKL